VGDISQYDLRNQIYYITVYLIVFLPFYYRDWFRTFVVIKSPTLLLPDLPIWATRWMSYKREEQLILRGHLGSLQVLVVSVLLTFLIFYVVFCYFDLLVFVLCLVCTMLYCVSRLSSVLCVQCYTVSLDCPLSCVYVILCL
jgi:hypothetical protein